MELLFKLPTLYKLRGRQHLGSPSLLQMSLHFFRHGSNSNHGNLAIHWILVIISEVLLPRL
jgi:hypothetical protein